MITAALEVALSV